MRRMAPVPPILGMLCSALLSACSSPTPPVAPGSLPPDAEQSSSPAFRAIARKPGTIDDEGFPRPADLEPQIAFWRNVYGTWRRSQVAIHDDRYLDVVYELIELPGSIEEGYGSRQKELVRERKDYWQTYLRGLEQSWTLNVPLEGRDRALLAQLEASAKRPDAILGAAERVHVQRGLRERFKRGLEISGRYEQAFRRIFRESGLPEDLAYLPHVESSFQAHAKSSAGAVGIWQFTRSAAHRFMTMNDAVDERLDPVASARGAARYLSHAHGKLSSWPLTLTSYNHGIAGMQRARDAVGDDFMRIVRHYDHPKFGFASRNFYAEFLAARDVARRPQQYFPEGVRPERPLDWERVVLAAAMPVSEVAQQYGLDRDRLIDMNAAWSEPVRADRVPLPAGTEVWLPAGVVGSANRGQAWPAVDSPATGGFAADRPVTGAIE